MKDKLLYQKREFLNKQDDLMASIIAKVEVSSGYKSFGKEPKEKESYDYCYTTLSISDCNRIISLDFDVETEKEFDNSMYKIDLLIDTFTEFRKALIKARNIIKVNNKEE